MTAASEQPDDASVLPAEENHERYLFLDGPRGRETFGPDTLLVFLDETGHEDLADARYPLFGMGGCVVPLRAYWSLIHDPWLEMKARHFGGYQTVMHAVDIGRRRVLEELQALASFFARMQFPRTAAVVTDRTTMALPLERLDVVFGAVAQHVAGFAELTLPLDRILVVMESNERAAPKIERFVRTLSFSLTQRGMRRPLPASYYHAPKTLRLPGLEVADFVMHAAGTAVRDHLSRGTPLQERRDFQAVFGSVPEAFAQFFLVNGLGVVRRGPGGPTIVR